jgi:sulfite reductase (NADPH) hemoprotein beta-component
MGDSKYWPRKEDYIYYNKAGKDMFNRLTSAGFPELLPLGLGDDSDPDGYMTGYKPFEAGLWRALGVDSVEVAEVQEETVANEHIKTASNYLRGTILDGLADTTTGAIGPSDGQLTKFHGTYMQVSTLLAIVAKLTIRMIEISEIRSRSRVLNPLTRS